MPGNIRIRRGRPSDLAGLLALEEACFQPWRRASPRSLLRSLRSPRQSVWVVDGGGDGLAALLVLWHHKRRIRVYDVATRPDLQGQGIGLALMAHTERLARKGGARDVSLEADAKDAPLIRWYRHQGYAVVDRMPHFYVGGRPAVRMRKPVAG